MALSGVSRETPRLDVPAVPYAAPATVLRIEVAGVVRALRLLVAILVVGTFAAQFATYSFGAPHGLTRFFDGDQKLNFPSLYKLAALATCAVLAWSIGQGRSNGRDGRAWRRLAWVMAFLAVDEGVFLHQSLSNVLHRGLGTGGVLHFAWVLVYLPLTLAFAVANVPFVLALPPRTRNLFVAAAVLFAGGSGGIEPVKSALASVSGDQTLQYGLVAALSDSAEMVGLALFLYALLDYAAAACPAMRVDIDGGAASPRPR